MGRNAIPKLFESIDGVLHRFCTSGNSNPGINPDGGELIVYERITASGTEVLATAWADGICDLMAAMFEDGYSRGKQEGYLSAQADIRRATGAKP